MQVLGIGDNVVDIYPQKGEMSPGGNTLNFCVYARMLGAQAQYISVLGNDEEGSLVARVLAEYGIGASRVRRAALPTNKCYIHLNNGDRTIEENLRYDLFREHPIVLSEEEITLAATCELVHTSVYTHIEGQLPQLKAAGAHVVFDFSHLWTEELLEQACPNIEVGFFSLGHLQQAEIEAFLQHIHAIGCPLAVATMGKRGACAYNGRRFYHKRPYFENGSVVDTLGAGDSFITGFSLCLAEGQKAKRLISGGWQLPENDAEDYEDHLLEAALARGNLMAARTCQTNGAFNCFAPCTGR